ncbi:MAG: hypothetical protein Q9172_002016 [Xanthocarpia lactea]
MAVQKNWVAEARKVDAPGFMDLPTEIRWQIYGYLLRPTGQIIIDDMFLAPLYWKDIPERTVYPYRQTSTYMRSLPAMATYHGSTSHRPMSEEDSQIHVNVLMLNSRIRSEATDCLYGQHLFFDCGPDAMRAFLADISIEARESILDISLAVPTGALRAEFRLLCESIANDLRLKRLNVRIHTYLWNDQPWKSVEGPYATAAAELMKVDWVESLLLIKELDALNFRLDCRYLMKEFPFGVAFTKSLQSRMLKERAAGAEETDDMCKEEECV